MSREWTELLSPHIAKFRLGAMFGGGVRYNAKGCDAMAILLKRLAADLDGMNGRLAEMECRLIDLHGMLLPKVTFRQRLADFIMGGPVRR